mgnify:FL=1
MNAVNRFRDWWVGQYRSQRGVGKVVWVAAPLVFACCFCWTALLVVVPTPDVEPTAELAERAGATVDVVDVVATEEPAEATAAPTEEPAIGATLTTAPSRTVAPSRTAAPRAGGERATAAAGPGVTPRPAVATPVPSATPRPATATRVPPTAPPPTATSAPPTAAPTRVPPTAVPPTAVPPTPLPPTAVVQPTAVPQPTATLPTAVGQLAITNVNKREEFVDIQNTGGTEVVLDGWTLRSEKGSQDCRLSGVLGPGQALRIWAMSEDTGQGGFNCQFGKEIWNNSEPDAAVLINPEGAEVSRR